MRGLVALAGIVSGGCNFLLWDNDPHPRPDASPDAQDVGTDVAPDVGTDVVPDAQPTSSGTFAAPVSYATQDDEPAAIVTGDFNGDGRPDVAVANHRDQGSQINNLGSVTIFVATSTGALQFSQRFAVGYGPVAIATGDFDSDGKLDLVTANLAQGMGGNLSIALGSGSGTFNTAVAASGCCSPQDVHVGDFNRDGKLDLAIANYQAVQIAIGNGLGGFASPVSYGAALGAYKLAVGDLDGNSKLDVIVGDYYYMAQTDVSVLLGNGNGSLQTAVGYTAQHSTTLQALADLDRDGKLDVITANNNLDSISVLRGNGAGALLAPTTYAMASVPTAIVAADFNGDGYPDVAVTANDTLVVRLNTGTGSLGAPASYPSGPATALASADFNGDGRLDLVTADPVGDTVNVSLALP